MLTSDMTNKDVNANSLEKYHILVKDEFLFTTKVTRRVAVIVRG